MSIKIIYYSCNYKLLVFNNYFLVFPGTTTDLMPTLLGMYDALLDTNKNISSEGLHKLTPKTSPIKKPTSAFTNLSPTVQKMLANISDQNENIEEEYTCKNNNKTTSVQKVSRYLEGQKSMYSSTRIHRQSKYYDQKNSVSTHLNKSTECLSAICDNVTSNVQKMLSHIPDQDLVISSCVDIKKQENTVTCDSNLSANNVNNSSFLYKMYSDKSSESVRRATSFNVTSTVSSECVKRTNKSLSPNLSAGHKFKSSTIPGNYLQVSCSLFFF